MADGGPGPLRPLTGRDPRGPQLAERAFWKTALLSNSNAASVTRQTLVGTGSGSLSLGREGEKPPQVSLGYLERPEWRPHLHPDDLQDLKLKVISIWIIFFPRMPGAQPSGVPTLMNDAHILP